MGFKEELERGFKETAIHRRRQSKLLTVGMTELPYVLLGESFVNLGDTVVRRGTMRVEEPALFLFHRSMQFEGFEDAEGSDPTALMMALGRVARFPPGRYSNIDSHLDVYEGSLKAAIDHYSHCMEEDNDRLTGLVTGPVDIWQLCLLVYAGAMIMQSAQHDLHDLIIRQNLPGHWS